MSRHFMYVKLPECHFIRSFHNPTNIYLFEVNNRDTKKGVKYVQS